MRLNNLKIYCQTEEDQSNVFDFLFYEYQNDIKYATWEPDPVARKFYLYSEQGDERVVDCETVDQFMSVLELVRDKCGDDVLAYADPVWGKNDF